MFATKDLCGSALKTLVLKRFWPGTTQEKQLAVASKRLVKFAKDNKLPLQLKKFSKKNIGWSTGRCPELHCKGYDTYVVLSFLVSEVTSKDCGSWAELHIYFWFRFYWTNHKYLNFTSDPVKKNILAKT